MDRWPAPALNVLLIAAIFVQALRLWSKARGTVWGAVALGGCGIMLAVASHNVFENLHVLNLGIQLSGIWGLMVVAEQFVGENEDVPANRAKSLLQGVHDYEFI